MLASQSSPISFRKDGNVLYNLPPMQMGRYASSKDPHVRWPLLSRIHLATLVSVRDTRHAKIGTASAGSLFRNSAPSCAMVPPFHPTRSEPILDTDSCGHNVLRHASKILFQLLQPTLWSKRPLVRKMVMSSAPRFTVHPLRWWNRIIRWKTLAVLRRSWPEGALTPKLGWDRRPLTHYGL